MTFLYLIASLAFLQSASANYYYPPEMTFNEPLLDDLENTVLKTYSYEPGDADFQKSRKIVYADFKKALPNLQLIVLVRKNLISIIESYMATNALTDTSYSAKAIQVLKEVLMPANGYHNRKTLELNFQRTSDGIFQVNGIKSNRLAVNTDSKILIHVNAMAKLDNFTIEDATQLLLHEFLHADKNTPLEEKDSWSTKVATFVKENSQSLNLGLDRKLITLILPTNVTEIKSLEIADLRYVEQILTQQLQKNNIILLQTKEQTHIYNEAYSGFKTFDNRTDNGEKQKYGYERTINWPQIQIKSIRANSLGHVLVDYDQLSQMYTLRPPSPFLYDRKNKGTTPATDNLLPQVPLAQFRIELDPATGAVETVRNYSSNLQTADFEINKITDQKEKRFISVHVRLENIASYLKSEPPHLIAKDVTNNQLLSISTRKIKLLNPQEALLHFEVPAASLQLSQILLPQSGSGFSYSEISIKPSKKIQIDGVRSLEKNQLSVDIFNVRQAKKRTDPTVGLLKLKGNKKITGITLDMQHTVALQEAYLPNGLDFYRHNLLTFAAISRKYSIDIKQIKTKSTIDDTVVQFTIPSQKMSEVIQGAVITQRISRDFTINTQTQAETIYDNGTRHITGAWIHFEDGTYEKVDSKKMPQGFSIISKEDQKKQQEQIKDNVDAYFESLDMGNPPKKPVTNKCNGLF